MAKHSSFITFALFALLLCHGSVAQFGFGAQSPWQSSHGPAQSRACRFDRLNALQPQQKIQHEAGRTEYYDETNEMFRCAGVSAQRHVINRRGLLLPTYSNAPSLIYIEQGKGFTGPIFPGCPETYQSFQFQSEQLQSESFQQHLRDSHQQVHRFREGDVLALPAGVSHWCYNDGDIPVVAVQVFDISNSANQLEQREREFLLAGNKQSGQQSFVRYKQFGNNILAGFDTQLLAEALGVNQDLARRLQSQHDRRGQIVHVPSGLKFIRPFRSQEQYQQQPQYQQQKEQEYEQGEQWGGYYNASNGLDESFCRLKIRANINNPSSADVYNQQGGMISYLNSQKLPILNIVQMSAKRVILRRNAMISPFWNVNAHSVMYVTGGQGRVQVVNNQGKTVFDGQLHHGQILIVPQNYAVLKRAHQQGFQWVSFKTNANSMDNKITGKVSTFRSLPLDVISSSYRITRGQAWRLKSSRREEMSIFTPLPQYHRETEFEQSERPYQYEQSAGSSQYVPEVEPSA